MSSSSSEYVAQKQEGHKIEKCCKQDEEEKEKEIDSTITYTEIYVCEPEVLRDVHDEHTPQFIKEIPISVSETFFLQILSNISIKQCPYKYFKRSHRTYVHHNIFLENKECKEGPNIEVYTKNMRMYTLDRNRSIVHVGYEKRKQPFHVFPSTTCLNAINFTKRMTFLITSYIYINFDIIYYLNENTEKFNSDPIFRIFINFNTEKNIDIGYSREKIEEAIRYITEK